MNVDELVGFSHGFGPHLDGDSVARRQNSFESGIRPRRIKPRASIVEKFIIIAIEKVKFHSDPNFKEILLSLSSVDY